MLHWLTCKLSAYQSFNKNGGHKEKSWLKKYFYPLSWLLTGFVKYPVSAELNFFLMGSLYRTLTKQSWCGCILRPRSKSMRGCLFPICDMRPLLKTFSYSAHTKLILLHSSGKAEDLSSHLNSHTTFWPQRCQQWHHLLPSFTGFFRTKTAKMVGI